MDSEIEKIKACNKMCDVAEILGYSYYNGKVKSLIISYCNSFGIDIVNFLKNKNKVFCLQCGKEICGKDKHRRKFCSSSCSAKYNNSLRGPVSDEQKEKTRQTIRNKYESNELVGQHKGKVLSYNDNGEKNGYYMMKV